MRGVKNHQKDLLVVGCWYHSCLVLITSHQQNDWGRKTAVYPTAWKCACGAVAYTSNEHHGYTDTLQVFVAFQKSIHEKLACPREWFPITFQSSFLLNITCCWNFFPLGGSLSVSNGSCVIRGGIPLGAGWLKNHPWAWWILTIHLDWYRHGPSFKGHVYWRTKAALFVYEFEYDLRLDSHGFWGWIPMDFEVGFPWFNTKRGPVFWRRNRGGHWSTWLPSVGGSGKMCGFSQAIPAVKHCSTSWFNVPYVWYSTPKWMVYNGNPY